MAGSVYEGKTFDEAVRKGLEALRLSRAEAIITTIEEGKGGFLGIGARPFRVSVSRRPGGAIREPAEREERRGGGRRGGRDERPARGGREAQGHGRGSRDGSREERGGRDGARAGRGKREERGAPAERGSGREERNARPAREERVAREDRAPAERASGRPPRPGREERPAREERAAAERGSAREDRAPREERVAREDRGDRHERGERAARPPREERHAAPAASSPVPPAVSESDDDSPRKRRRRGRRGGRGRRRGGAGEHDEAPAVGANGAEAAEPVVMESREPMETREPMESRAAVETHMPSPSPFAPIAPTSQPLSLERETPMMPVEASSESFAPPAREEGFGGHRRERRDRSRGRERGGEGRESREASGAPDMNTEELISTSRKLTEDLLRAMGFEPRVSVRAEGNRVDVTVEVDNDEQLLIGRQGETRQSLQHLLNRFLNKGDGSRYHLQLEVNDSWQQREDELAGIARKMAEDAVSQNAEIVSDYLNSQERRIMHMTLREDARVRTFSLGMGMVKRVAVAPASFPERSEDDSAS